MQQPVSDPITKCDCTPITCHATCALEVVDTLLRETESVSGEDVDALLDFRWLLRHAEDAEAALNVFCQLRRSMESRHYLAFYRLRRWLENHIEARVRLCRGLPEEIVPLQLNRYCLEAIRFQCLKAAARPGQMLLAPRVRFQFQGIPAPTEPVLSLQLEN